MGDLGFIGTVAASAMGGAAAAALILGRLRLRGKPTPDVQVDAELERQLARARELPGAEGLLVRLSAQPIIFSRELADLAAQLDQLERKAKVDATLRQIASDKRAPLVARAAKQAMAEMCKRRTQNNTPSSID